MALDIDTRALPYGLRIIVEKLGAEQAITVLTEHQGQVFYIPPTPKKGDVVVKVFGQELAQLWAQQMGGGTYQVPMLNKVLMQLRNREICSALDKRECSIQELVRRFRITRQQITSIYAEHKQDRSQLGLGF
ncbi:Mor transcription activator family protein [Pseudoalteromonas sp. T1lg10]|uniref:Mor transcription activator family protein n=1 Tax=Pseudoalteromonas sp. T1lg10 TaxID=2077093 RepID=UPI001F2E0CDD|nr:Mor transcription activator family protein [Pseudoalteromonas sp. T1lg10]